LSVTRIGLVVVALVAGIAVVFALYQAFDQRSAPPIVIEDAAATLPLVVEMRGEIEAPGVYELAPGARLQDAIAAAGGLTEEADPSTVNLARRLRDGELITVLALPVPGSTPKVPLADAGDAAKADEARGKININTATARELEALPGVGEVIAARIVAYRDQTGPFRSVDDLIHVEGLSDRAIDKIRELVTTAP
jgi:competence protein ComEA